MAGAAVFLVVFFAADPAINFVFVMLTRPFVFLISSVEFLISLQSVLLYYWRVSIDNSVRIKTNLVFSSFLNSYFSSIDPDFFGTGLVVTILTKLSGKTPIFPLKLPFHQPGSSSSLEMTWMTWPGRRSNSSSLTLL